METAALELTAASGAASVRLSGEAFRCGFRSDCSVVEFALVDDADSLAL